MSRLSLFMLLVSAATIALLAQLIPSQAAAGPRMYVGVEKCSVCHKKQLMGDQVSVWKQGPHPGAMATLESQQSAAIAAKRGLAGKPSEAPECLRCHLTAYDAAPAEIAYPLDRRDGVQCESCHGPGYDYRKKKIMSDVDEARSKGLWDPGAGPEVCVRCHNRESPTFDPDRYRLPNGEGSGFDFDQALEAIRHTIPEDVRGRYIELEEEQKKRDLAERLSLDGAN